jgi:hypothetical protein
MICYGVVMPWELMSLESILGSESSSAESANRECNVSYLLAQLGRVQGQTEFWLQQFLSDMR